MNGFCPRVAWYSCIKFIPKKILEIESKKRKDVLLQKIIFLVSIALTSLLF